MRCVGRFYAIAKNDIFLVEKAVKQFFIYFSMTGGASSYVEGLSMADMVEQEYLVPMKYYGADAPDLALVKLNADGDYQEKGLAEATDKPELIGSIYTNYKRIAGDRTTLIFAVNANTPNTFMMNLCVMA